ncbi:hypothetical protein MTR67_011621 [Solanum verrucosum]|uniref:Uncharacterized protein n=1 Tax=Solanum verrucosum TaxID=315347 RepID=A0AAF0QCZ0_SOLVR|nr:hypothetical protein MTR67_011621 [Solanum verrucosum]
MNLTPLEINTDSTNIMHMINNNNLLYDNSIVECKYLMMKLEIIKLFHMF